MDRQEPTLAEEIETTAELALLELSDTDRTRFEDAVRTLLDHFAVMATIDVTDLPPTTHALVEGNRVREDSERGSGSTESRELTPSPDEVLEQAPDLEDRFITIPNVL